MNTNQFTAAILQAAIYRCERMLLAARAANDADEIESQNVQLEHLRWKLERYLNGAYDAQTASATQTEGDIK